MLTVADFNITAVFAHPDDAELAAGGTLAREAARGRRIALVDLTRGESGSRGTPEIRALEAAEAARILGAAHRESLALPDARLAVIPEHKDPVAAAASRIVHDACYLAGLRSYRPDLGAAFRPRKLLYTATMTEATAVAPSFVVDITEVWPIKLRAIDAFASQFTPAAGETGPLPLDRFREAVELAGRRHGQHIGVRYGEGFLTREPLAVEDVLALGGSSL